MVYNASPLHKGLQWCNIYKGHRRIYKKLIFILFQIFLFPSRFIHNLLSCFSDICVFSIFIAATYDAYDECQTESDCPKNIDCVYPKSMKCIDKKCICVGARMIIPRVL